MKFENSDPHHKLHDVRRDLIVTLGSHNNRAFVAASKSFLVIGMVRMGMEFGLLAKTTSGKFVRVNGSLVEVLNTQLVEQAIQKAKTKNAQQEPAMPNERPAKQQYTDIPVRFESDGFICR